MESTIKSLTTIRKESRAGLAPLLMSKRETKFVKWILLMSIVLVFLLSPWVDAHKKSNESPVHQWIANQAFYIWPNDTQHEIYQYKGDLTVDYDSDDPRRDCRIGENIIKGTHDEDDFDVLSDQPNFWEDSQGGSGSNFFSHFWDNDQEDVNSSGLSIQGLGTFWSAAKKAEFYWFGGEDDYPYISVDPFQHTEVRSVDHVQFDGLLQLYKDGKKGLAYYYLGRVAHLLTDMGVPAHVNNDPHAFLDTYESFVGYGNNYARYTYSDYIGGQITYDLYPLDCPWSEPQWAQKSKLFKIFHYLSEKAAQFESNNEDGEDSQHQKSHNWAIECQEAIGGINSCGLHNVSYEEAENHAEILMPKTIKAISDLYKLFWHTTHPTATFSTPLEGNTITGTYSLTVSTTGVIDEVFFTYWDQAASLWKLIDTATNDENDNWTADFDTVNEGLGADGPEQVWLRATATNNNGFEKNTDIWVYVNNSTTTGPILSVTPASLIFNAQHNQGNPTPQYIKINNTGFTWTATRNPSWISLSNYSSSAPSNVQVEIDSSNLQLGENPGIIKISAEGVTNSPVEIPVIVNISPDTSPPGQPNLIADSWVTKGGTYNNYESDTKLRVGNQQGREAFIKFDISPIMGKPVYKAELEVYCKYVVLQGSKTNIKVRPAKVLGKWEDWQINYNNKPDISDTGTAKTLDDGDNGTWIKFDITTLARRWAKGWDTNYGVALRQYDSNNYSYVDFSSQESSNHPRLKVQVLEGTPDLVTSTPVPDNGNSSPPFYVGQSVDWHTTVANISSGGSDSSHVGYYIGDSPTDISNYIGRNYVRMLPGGETSEENKAYTFKDTDVGINKYLIVKADYLGNIAETIDDNNISYYGPFEVRRPKSLDVNPGSLNFFASEGRDNPEPQFLSISNSGDGELNWTASSGAASWLNLNPAKGLGNASIRVSVDIAGLTQANSPYTEIITIDALGATESPRQILVTLNVILNEPPTATIDSITPNPATPGSDTVSFSGSGIDNDEGGASIIAYNWQSSLDGDLSSSASFTRSANDPSVGAHTIYFKVKDNEQLWSYEDSEILTINNNPPTANISSISPGTAEAGQTITFSGSGQDYDENESLITEYSWRSDVDGVIGVQNHFDHTTLSVGTHNIYLKVRDDEGTWSEEVLGTVTITDNTPPYTEGHDPAKGAINVPINSLIIVKLKDDGAGVDMSSIVMTLNGETVAPIITGTPREYEAKYIPQENFAYNQTINITISASDLASSANTMPVESYSLTTAGIMAKTIAPSKDAWVEYVSPDANHGTDTSLLTGFTDEDTYEGLETYIFFDVLNEIPSGSTVTQATISLYCWDIGSIPYDYAYLDSYPVVEAWQENTITWSNKPGFENWGAGQDFTTTGWVTVDVTEFVQKWMDGTLTNHGVVFQNDWEMYTNKFYSREFSNTALRPKLEVQYYEAGAGTLSVTSTPEVAKIFIDDVDTGFVTPHDFAVDTGSYNIKITKDGYVDWGPNKYVVNKDGTTLVEAELIKGVKVSIPVTEDAFVGTGYWPNPDQNYGSEPTLYLGVETGNPDANFKSYLKFSDLSVVPADQIIVEAKLKLFCYVRANFGPYINIHEVTSSWAEGSITWNNVPSNGSDIELRQSIYNAWNYFQITGLFREWYEGSKDNYGLLLNPESYGTSKRLASFRSKEGSYQPVIEVIYRAPDPGDITPPTGTITINGGAVTTTSTSVTLALSATDEESGMGSGNMMFSNNNSTWSSPELYSDTKSWTLEDGDGTKTVYVKFMDADGNWSVAYYDSIVLNTPDITPPGTPINLNVTPSGWTNNNSFVIDWSNPSDPSGIAGAYYKIGSPPTSSDDGTYTTDKPILGINATVADGQNIYVSLKDGSGNVNHENYSQAVLYYDGTAPTFSSWTKSPTDLKQDSSGNLRVFVTIEDTGGSGIEGIIPQCSYYVQGGSYNNYQNMTHDTGDNWYYDIPDQGWSDLGGLDLYYRVKCEDVAGNEGVSGEQSELIDWATPSQVTSPNPTDGATDIGITYDISWDFADWTESYDVYFGTEYNSVFNANTNTPDIYEGNQTEIYYNPGILNQDQTYYWRIDSVNHGLITKGDVWSFATETIQLTSVTVEGRQILVNGEPFAIKGVGYSPVPIGIDPETTAPYGDYFTSDYSIIYDRDLPVLREMGTNIIRLWGWNNTFDHTDFLDKAYNGGNNPLYVIVTFWMGPSVYPDITSPSAREQIKSDFRAMVEAHKNHPALLMWSIGNELNADWMYGGNLDDLFSLINEMAEEAHEEEGSNYHPVTTPLLDSELTNTIATYNDSIPSLDIWGINIYRGNTFGNLFDDYEAVSDKPLVILEYGIDAYDNVNGDEYENMGTPYQAEYAGALWNEIVANSDICAGGSIMAYSDEWWKGKHSTDPGCPDDDPAYQGTCGYAAASHPDGYANEEWWGIMRAVDNGAEPDIMESRAVYYTLQALWLNLPNISVDPASVDFGEVYVNTSSEAQTFTISNTGGGDLEIDTITLTGADGSEFSTENYNCSNQTMEPSGTCIIDVVFSPTSTGSKSTNLSIPSNDPDTPTFGVPLTGAGIQQYTLTVDNTGTGVGRVTSSPAGIDCGTDCTEIYDEGTELTLTATPDASSIFAGWSDGGCSGTGTCHVTMNEDTAVTASFSLKTYTITATSGTNGSISPSGSVTVNHGAEKSFTITPDTNYHVADVLVDGSSVGAVTSYTFSNVTSDHTIAASFGIPPTADAGPDQTVNEGDTVTLDGSNSTDPDDGIASYLWEQTAGPSATLSDPTAVQLTFTAPDVGPDGESLAFQLTVTDNAGLESTDTCDINVNWVNVAPTASAQMLTINEDTSVNITLTGSDIDGDALTYSIVAQPSHGTLSGTAPELTYSPDANYNGSDSFTFIANDGLSDSNIATVSITVNPVNDAPTISGTPATSVDEDTPYSFTPTAEDIDVGDALTFSITNKPSWASFDTSTGALTGTPGNDDVGTTSGIVITVEDTSAASASLPAFNLTVIKTNDPPTFTSTPVTSATEDNVYTYNVTTTDVDIGDTLTITGTPAWLTLTDNGDGTATLAGTPSNDDVGDHAVELTVTDSAGATDTQSFTISVSNTNDAPTISGTPSTSVDEDTAYSFTPTANDMDIGDTLTFSITNKPAWASFDTSTGSLTGTPDNDDVGTTTGIVITVTDSRGANASLPAFDLTVVTKPVQKGDVNGDGNVDLTDAILAVQIVSGITPTQAVYEAADVNGDGKIGIEEVIYILQNVSGLR